MIINKNLDNDGYQLRIDYDGRSDGQPVYRGLAAPGVSTSSSAWTIYKFTYTTDQLTLRQISFKASWDNRATEDYS